MSGIVLQTRAIDAKRTGGGECTRTERHAGFIRIGTRQRHDPSLSVAFICPGCKARNRKLHHQALYKTGDEKTLQAFAFRCHGCSNIVEVSAPRKQQPLIHVA